MSTQKSELENIPELYYVSETIDGLILRTSIILMFQKIIVKHIFKFRNPSNTSSSSIEITPQTLFYNRLGSII